MSTNIFEKATREGLRFESTKGLLTVEDLWKLPLTSAKSSSLNSIAKVINKSIKDEGEEDFVNTSKSSESSENHLKLDILKYIIQVRLTENEEATKIRNNLALKNKIAGIIASKQDEDLQSKSLEELQEMAASL